MLKQPTPVYKGSRPTKIRKIPMKYSSYRGQVNTTKFHLRNKFPPISYAYESILERDFYYLLDHDINCIEIIPQPTWENEENHSISADCWVAFYMNKTWEKYLFEIKPKKKIPELEKKENWNKKITFLTNLCEKKGWKFKIITEEYIYNNRFKNIKKLYNAVRIPPNKRLLADTIKNLSVIYRKNSIYTFSELQLLLSKKTSSIQNPEGIKNLIEYLIFYQTLWFEWEHPITSNTPIYLNLNHAIRLKPVYNLDPNPLRQITFEPEMIHVENDLDLILEEEKHEALKRYKTIQPLLDVQKERRIKEKEVQLRATEEGVDPRTIYRWLKRYNEIKNWKGLISRTHRKGNHSARFLPEVEAIISEILENRVPMSSIKACWIEVKQDCQKLGLDAPSYMTMLNRAKQLQARERVGKQGKFFHDEIPRNVTGSLPRGKYPLDFIQVDSTLLDIFLVDLFNKNMIKRPTLTIALDVRTRMIYSWLLDFNPPNSVDICRMLMRGFLPKDELLRKFQITEELPYPIYGVCRRIQFDNAKCFDNIHVKDFCLRYCVEDIQFRLVKRPDLGGYVERMFRTINEGMIGGKSRGKPLKGYAPPLKNRPHGINPEKEATWTLPEFEKWLVRQFIIYHHKSHSGLLEDHLKEKSPIEQYNEDMAYRSPPEPINKSLLKFEIFKPVQRTLRPEGITWNRNYYNNDGNTKKLANIRKRERGKSKSVLFRYDPEDIRFIWLYDNNEYIKIRLSRGLLKNFCENHLKTPIKYNEYMNLLKRLRREHQEITSQCITDLLEETKIIEEINNTKRYMRKKQRKRPSKIQSTRKGEMRENDQKQSNTTLFISTKDLDDPYADLKIPITSYNPKEGRNNDPHSDIKRSSNQPKLGKIREDPYAHIKFSIDKVPPLKQAPSRKDKV